MATIVFRCATLLFGIFGTNLGIQTALDYAESPQRALLVEGIRPVLPLIRNTPYGKRIQNKLQREVQTIEYNTFRGHDHLVNMALANQGLSPAHTSRRHLAPGIPSSLSDVYLGNVNIYSLNQTQANFTQAHLPAEGVDGYVLQSTSSHNQGIGPHNGFSGGLFNSLSDPYQRSAFSGYGM